VINKKGSAMQENDLSILRPLKESIDELIPPLDAAQKEIHGEDKDGNGIPEFTSEDYVGLFQEFLTLYPDKRLTLDHVPASIRLLQSYDQGHDTQFALKAKSLFIQFAGAIVKADRNEDFEESIVLANFKDVLDAA
jgi:hypothetical protein